MNSALSFRYHPKQGFVISIRLFLRCIVATVIILTASGTAFGQDTLSHKRAVRPVPPASWIDSDTGYQVTRVGEFPAFQLPFNQNAFTPDGRDMIYSSPKGIYDLNLQTRQSTLLVPGQSLGLLVGTKTRHIFYVMFDKDKADQIQSMDIDSKAVRMIGRLPLIGDIASINADETLIAGTNTPDLHAKTFAEFHNEELTKTDRRDGLVMEERLRNPRSTETLTPPSVPFDRAAKARFEEKTPEEIFTINIATGKRQTILHGTDWLANLQFSPADPTLLLYAHEGPPRLADRVWTIRTDGSKNQLMHRRSQPGEEAVNEFWSSDGKEVWFDLKLPHANAFLASVDVQTGKETLLHLSRSQAALHFGQSADGSLFVGGGRNNKPERHAKALTEPQLGEEWLEVLRPVFLGSMQGAGPEDPSSFTARRIVNLSKNDYIATDPNARFTPDGKSIVFTADMYHSRYIFIVDLAATHPVATAGN